VLLTGSLPDGRERIDCLDWDRPDRLATRILESSLALRGPGPYRKLVFAWLYHHAAFGNAERGVSDPIASSGIRSRDTGTGSGVEWISG